MPHMKDELTFIPMLLPNDHGGLRGVIKRRTSSSKGKYTNKPVWLQYYKKNTSATASTRFIGSGSLEFATMVEDCSIDCVSRML